ncbi:hypothetical protein GCM10011374_03330 [Kocuria dechangensis]|uniref:Uncharacterized protein n=1 Tax=Kocuria dechangensis TaxID=1176249 RepID=A0A917LN31_9MICC|nr:hypothetical protein GCM10011374_03330 [Kocuria dechangensis]
MREVVTACGVVVVSLVVLTVVYEAGGPYRVGADLGHAYRAAVVAMMISGHP